jgi:hypothetical protein
MYRLFVLLGLMLLLLAGCAHVSTPLISPLRTPDQREVAIPFETLILEEWGGFPYYQGQEPQLILLTTPEEVDRLADKVSSEVLEQIRRVNFTDYAVLALFRGLQTTSNYETVIERIVRQNNLLLVFARFRDPEGGAAVSTSPFHIIKLLKEEINHEQMKLELHIYIVR